MGLLLFLFLFLFLLLAVAIAIDGRVVLECGMRASRRWVHVMDANI